MMRIGIYRVFVVAVQAVVLSVVFTENVSLATVRANVHFVTVRGLAQFAEV